MTDIGDFRHNEEIKLELILTDTEGNPLEPTDDVTFTITGPDEISLIEEENVKMNMISSGVFDYTLLVKEEWPEGLFLVTYFIPFEEGSLQEEETFSVVSDEKEEDFEDFFGSLVYTPGMQIDSTVTINNKIITIELNPEDIRPNRDYTVVLTKDIETEDGKALKKDYRISFSSEYKPLYASVSEVQYILRSLKDFFKANDILKSIRNAGIKAHQMRRLEANPDNPQFRLIEENDSDYYALTRYVSFEAARTLIQNLIIDLLNGDIDNEKVASLTGGFTLGDLSIRGDSESSGGTVDQPVQRLNKAVDAIQQDHKFWQDAMMGHNRRGYAAPSGGTFRGGADSPEEREF